MTTSPTSDSLKMPIVLMAIDRKGITSSLQQFAKSVFSNFSSGFASENEAVLQDYLKRMFPNSRDTLVMPMWEYLQSFSFERGGDQHSQATFTLFDPQFYTLLAYFAQVRASQPDYAVYFQWGWFDNGEFQLTPVYEFAVLSIDPQFAQDGMFITIKAVQEYILSADGGGLAGNRGFTVNFKADTPGHLIVKAIVETDWDEIAATRGTADEPIHVNGDDLVLISQNNDVLGAKQRPYCKIGVKCKPLNSATRGSLLMTVDRSPMQWLRESVIPQLVPDRELSPFAEDHVFLVETSERGVFNLTSATDKTGKDFARGAFAHRTPSPVRVYHVGRSIRGNVLAFGAQDMMSVANMLGGAGASFGIDPRKPKGQQVVSAPIESLNVRSTEALLRRRELGAASLLAPSVPPRQKTQREQQPAISSTDRAQLDAILDVSSKVKTPVTDLYNYLIQHVSPAPIVGHTYQQITITPTPVAYTDSAFLTRVDNNLQDPAFPRYVLVAINVAASKQPSVVVSQESSLLPVAVTRVYTTSSFLVRNIKYSAQNGEYLFSDPYTDLTPDARQTAFIHDMNVLIQAIRDSGALKKEQRDKQAAVKKYLREVRGYNKPLLEARDHPPIGYIAKSPAQSFANLAYQRINNYHSTYIAAVNAEATIIGDPSVELLDNVVFNVYSGATISGSGRYEDSNTTEGSNNLQIVPYVSGMYNILGIRDVIQGGRYTQTFTLVRVHQLGAEFDNTAQLRTEEAPLLGESSNMAVDTSPARLADAEFLKYSPVIERVPDRDIRTVTDVEIDE